MKSLNVLAIQRTSAPDQNRIRQLDPRIKLVDAGGWFDDEVRQSWPPFAVDRYLGNRAAVSSTRQQRDHVLATAEVIYGGFPFPLDLRQRAPALKWFHQRPAGASNLQLGDLWGSDVLVTTSRGAGEVQPIAEYVLAAFLHFARSLDRAYHDQRAQGFDYARYQSSSLLGKTVCVIGAGGIGQAVARLCSALGMRVIGTRRQPGPRQQWPAAFDHLASPAELRTLLSESDFIAVCCHWTPQTTHLLDEEAFAAMKSGAVLVNVARGEIVDEDALVTALQQGHLRGAALDVYVGEFERPPSDLLWHDERVLITPHVSSMTDVARHRAIDVFCDNLQAYLAGEPLSNVVDWQRGY